MTTRRIFRRKREGKTDYRNRLALIKSGKARLVVRITGKNVIAQVVQYEEGGDRVIATVTSLAFPKLGIEIKGNSTLAAYVAGYEVGKKALEKGISEMVLDIGRRKIIKGGRLAASLKGAVDAGCSIPHDESIFPTEERLMGKHLKSGGMNKTKMKELFRKVEGVKN
ncbi:MAG: 50S ribosomal protein L18 [Candidatus Thermoplasmatota archaeon]|nr:50S ribosomal protein L18 [Candidatus Thermoplasmatota archaeon]MCL5730546.1 50S ribosomal protein L18 [Candidatus Thermoplasmatota archaeon]